MGQKRTHAVQQKALLFDHLVGELLEMQRHVEAQRLGDSAQSQYEEYGHVSKIGGLALLSPSC
jgi:hypothetical protein